MWGSGVVGERGAGLPNNTLHPAGAPAVPVPNPAPQRLGGWRLRGRECSLWRKDWGANRLYILRARTGWWRARG